MYITELARKNFSPFFTACRVKQVLSLGTIEKISINPVDIIVVQMQMYANIVLFKKTLSVVFISEVGYRRKRERWLQPLRYYPLFLLSFFLNSILTKRRCLAKFLKLLIFLKLKCRWQNIHLNSKYCQWYDIVHFVLMAISVIVLLVSNL